MNVEPYPIKTSDYKVSMVNRYDINAMKTTEREAVIDEVLEIIDSMPAVRGSIYLIDRRDLVDAVLALKKKKKE